MSQLSLKWRKVGIWLRPEYVIANIIKNKKTNTYTNIKAYTNTKANIDTPSNTNTFFNHLYKNANANTNTNMNKNTNIDMGLAVT